MGQGLALPTVFVASCGDGEAHGREGQMSLSEPGTRCPWLEVKP